MAVALAVTAVGEAPVSRLTAVTTQAKGSRAAWTLTAERLTESGLRPLQTALAWFASSRPEAVGPRRTLFTATAEHVGAAATLPSVGVTLRADGALRVTLTRQSSVVDGGRQAAD